MLISKAYAQSVEIATETADAAMQAPSTMESFMWNMGLVLVLVVMFYLLLIRPQQRRFKEHTQMLDALKKGDKVITGGGLIGKIEKIVDDEEVVVDLGNGTKVTALRSTLQGKTELVVAKPANDSKKEDKKKDGKK